MPSWTKMTDVELGLAKKWYVDGTTTAEIAERLGRNQSTITRLLVKRVARKKQGRRAILTSAAVDKLEAKLEAMIEKANGRYEVTVAALRRSARAKASCRTILDALHGRGIYFRRLREKPVLTEEDIGGPQGFCTYVVQEVCELVEHGDSPHH